MRASKKYGEALEQPHLRPWPLNNDDTKDLARLVRKYGRETIAATAKQVPERGPGRPARNADEQYFERIALAGILEDWTEEYRQQGSRKPKTDALLTLYEVMHAGAAAKPDLQKFLKTQKRKLIPARRELQALKAAYRRMQQSGKWGADNSTPIFRTP